MNCRRRGPGSAGPKPDEPSKEGNAVKDLGDKHGMEYKPKRREPGSDSGMVVDPRD